MFSTESPSKHRLGVFIQKASDSEKITSNLFLISDDEAEEWAKKLDELKNECGCKAGTRFVFLCFIIGLIAILTNYESLKTVFIGLLLLLPCMFAAGLAGKFIKKTSAYREFHLTIKQLRTLLNSRMKGNVNICQAVSPGE